MDPDNNIHSKDTNVINNEKKKKMATVNVDPKQGGDSQMDKKTDNEGSGNESSSSADSEDLVNAINYNTITSLAALKDILQGDNNDTPETDSFFQHYFMNHCNNLSSRNSASNSPFPFADRRRLSQCREEDEEDSSHPAAATEELFESTPKHKSKSKGQTDNNSNTEKSPDKSKRTVMGAKHKFLVTTTEVPSKVEKVLRSQVHNAHTVHFGTKGAEELRPSVRSIFAGQNLHRDKNYFDSSLISIKSTVDDSIDASAEDIWVKQPDNKPILAKADSLTVAAGKDDLSPDKKDIPRARSGTWGAQSTRPKEKDPKKVLTSGAKKDPVRKGSDDRRQKREQRLDAAITRSSQSVGERRRRGSSDEQQDALYQQTIHGTSGVSRRPALFDMFKSKPKGAEAKRQPSIYQQVKAAMQNMTKSTAPAPEALKDEASKPVPRPHTPGPPAKTRDGSAHPHPGSDARYYHTMTASATRRPSAMAKVMDIFRGRASTPGEYKQSATMEKAEIRMARAIAKQLHSTPGKLILISHLLFYLS